MTTTLLIICIIGLIILWKDRQKKQVEITKLKDHLFHLYPEQWLRELNERFYNNETEVEIKFIMPLMMYLGYSLDEMKNRVFVSVQAGTQALPCEADWIIVPNTGNSEDRLLIEAKAPSVSLNSVVKKQAQSYAHTLGIPKYIITNGRQLIVYDRGVEHDQEILNLYVNEFAEQWDTIKEALGPKVETL
ncbi:type I restriction enzyme HsdR N-terminal domain-containing protein [Candidatus Latescibacterota bacterium]